VFRRTIARLDASAADGEQRAVRGIVRVLDDVVHAPRSGRACVAFSVRIVELLNRDGGGMGGPYTASDACPFEIELQSGGNILVDSAFVDIQLPLQPVHDEADTWTAYCDERGLSYRALVDEAIVMAGATVTAVGAVERRAVPPGPEDGYREARHVLALVGDFDHPLRISR
jgi:hypothetical protein